MQVNCTPIVLLPIAYAMCSPIVCSPVTAMRYGVSYPVLGAPHSERAFLPIKPNASARDLQEAEKRNQCPDLRDKHDGQPDAKDTPTMLGF